MSVLPAAAVVRYQYTLKPKTYVCQTMAANLACTTNSDGLEDKVGLSFRSLTPARSSASPPSPLPANAGSPDPVCGVMICGEGTSWADRGRAGGVAAG